MTLAIISGDFDLSVGSQMALGSIVFTTLLTWNVPIIAAALAVVVLGMVMGSVNGTLIAKMKIPAFIATLGMQMAYRALAQMINGSPVTVKNAAFLSIATGKLLELPILFWIMIGLAVLGTVVLRKTKIGRDILAIGNSKEAARISGINVGRTQIAIYFIVGLLTAAATLMGTARNGASNYNNFMGYEFSVISAVVLGGTALAGGKGSIFKTIIAAIFLSTLNSALPTYGVNAYAQKIIEGCVLVFAFSINGIRSSLGDVMLKRRSRRELRERLHAKT
jgi:ribose/xylose/arabinose/galactoside ABC-type transport system permease subunit